ncbi:MAG: hypothetical protein OJJ54_14485, partial [Pseudonocardia sp.]|nr:hypothetical protein [Pseudonocardia sp.]
PAGPRRAASPPTPPPRPAPARRRPRSRAEPSDASAVARLARRAGHLVERTGETHLDLVLPA